MKESKEGIPGGKEDISFSSRRVTLLDAGGRIRDEFDADEISLSTQTIYQLVINSVIIYIYIYILCSSKATFDRC